jgi:polyisoprenyl-phosphate glycosyltransferase
MTAADPDRTPELSLVVPVFDEEGAIAPFLDRAVQVLDDVAPRGWEIVFVDDGSRDGTLAQLVAAHGDDPRVRVVSLARNFGKDVALSAGLAHASGAAVVPIDVDLEHPPEVIRDLVASWRRGHDMVLAVRGRRDEQGLVRRFLSRRYYGVLGRMTKVRIPPDAGDFRLLDRRVVDVINQMPERCRFMKGLFAWPGFKTAEVEFRPGERSHGRSRWSLRRLWRFALDGLFSFSTVPLQIWTYIGLVCAGGAFAYFVVTVAQKLFWGIDVPGYASLLSVVLFFNGVLLVSNGIQGEYLARIFEEVKGRPLYVVGGTWGIAPDPGRRRLTGP